MLELPRIQSRYGTHQRPRRSVHIRVTGIGAHGFVADLIVVELHVERFFHIADRASRSHVEVAGARLHDLQIVRCEKLPHRLRLLRGWPEAGSNVFRLQPVMVVGRSAIIERLGQRIELAPVVKLQPDADFDNLRWILGSEILRRCNVVRRVVRYEFATHGTGRQQRTSDHDYDRDNSQ